MPIDDIEIYSTDFEEVAEGSRANVKWKVRMSGATMGDVAILEDAKANFGIPSVGDSYNIDGRHVGNMPLTKLRVERHQQSQPDQALTRAMIEGTYETVTGLVGPGTVPGNRPTRRWFETFTETKPIKQVWTTHNIPGAGLNGPIPQQTAVVNGIGDPVDVPPFYDDQQLVYCQALDTTDITLMPRVNRALKRTRSSDIFLGLPPGFAKHLSVESSEQQVYESTDYWTVTLKILLGEVAWVLEVLSVGWRHKDGGPDGKVIAAPASETPADWLVDGQSLAAAPVGIDRFGNRILSSEGVSEYLTFRDLKNTSYSPYQYWEGHVGGSGQ